MMDIPTLSTERLELRPFTETDSDGWWRLLQGEDVLRYFPVSAPPPKERAKDLVSKMIGHWEEHGYGLWAVALKSSGELAGRCGLQYLQETDSIEIDFIFGRRFWGQGLATEAARAGVRYGFEVLGAEKLTGIVHVENRGSQRVLEKLGMQRVRAARFFGIDCYEYEVRPEFLDGSQGDEPAAG